MHGIARDKQRYPRCVIRYSNVIGPWRNGQWLKSGGFRKPALFLRPFAVSISEREVYHQLATQIACLGGGISCRYLDCDDSRTKARLKQTRAVVRFLQEVRRTGKGPSVASRQ